MSYDVYIYHRDVRNAVRDGREIDEIELTKFSEQDVSRFLERLEKYGYQKDSEASAVQEFVKQVGKCPIQVSLFDAEISFSVPYWDGSDEAIPEVLQDATELADSESWVVYDPQADEWIE